jgi:tetratricopeptide (TPR) repeat protein
MIRALVLLALLAGVAEARTAADAPIGARAQAMGGAFTAIADDGNALYWNVAGLSRLGHQEFTSTLGDLYGAGLQDNHLGYVFPITDTQAASLSWRQASQDDAGLGYAENTFSLGYAFRFGKRLAVGAVGRYLNATTELDGSRFTEWTGSTFDLGVHYAYDDRLAFGATLKDVTGRSVTHKDGPTEKIADPALTVGAAFKPVASLTIASDVNDRLHLGAEWWYRNLFAVQGGAQKDLAKKQGTDGEGIQWSMGASARWKILQFDYAHVMPSFLPAFDRFTAAVAFNLNPSRIRVDKAQLDEVFASQSKRYAAHPVGSVKLTSRSEEPQVATLSVFVPGLMDAPTEKEIVVRPKEVKDVPLTAVFGNELLKLDEDKAVQADVRLSYRHKNRTRVEKATTSFFVYRPGAISWDDTRAAAAFVTPNDPVVDGFARAVVQGRDQAFEGGPLRNVMTAMRLFNALSGYGITYVPDPNNPFSSASETKSAIDQVQYPRGLLASRTGDCDDMSVLYCTVLENVGIPTAFLDGPGHILMMFDSGIHPRNALALSVDEDLYVVDGERVWIPVETTMIGKSFLDAWSEGASIYQRWKSASDFHVTPIEAAWAEYIPSLPESPAPSVTPPAADVVDKRFAADLDSLKAWQAAYLKQKFLEPLEAQPKSARDVGHENQLALVHALDGRLAAAAGIWDSVLVADRSNATALNNRGNVALLEGRADEAAKYYDRARSSEQDPGTILNQGLAAWAQGDTKGADARFGEALALLPDPAAAERLLGLPAPAGGHAETRRLTVEEIRQRLHLAAQRVPRQDANVQDPGAARGNPAKVVSKVSGARASDLRSSARVMYWKGNERGSL